MPSPQHTLTLVRTIEAPAALIYAAWTEPRVMRGWLARRVEADVRVGGRYRIENLLEDGSVFGFHGEYLELDPDRRIVQSFLGDEAEPEIQDPFIEVTLRPADGFSTELTLSYCWDGKALDAQARADVLDGWSSWLDQLDDMFAQLSG